eukprot:scaffold188727_cov27-Tisochrysis_lutea.AAC.1
MLLLPRGPRDTRRSHGCLPPPVSLRAPCPSPRNPLLPTQVEYVVPVKTGHRYRYYSGPFFFLHRGRSDNPGVKYSRFFKMRPNGQKI